jgi:hypothetical protein
MLRRLGRIHREFGLKVSARMMLMAIGLLGMSLLGLFAFSSPWAAIVTTVGLVSGWLLRRSIVDHFETFTPTIPAGLLISGVVVFVGERLGWSREWQLLTITITTVFLFSIQFWWFSDPAVINAENEGES